MILSAFSAIRVLILPQSSLVLRFVKVRRLDLLHDRGCNTFIGGMPNLCQDHFDDYRESTIGAAFLTQTISLDDSTTVKFEIWDTAGQERYKSLAPMYYRNANCAVVVYDITQAVRSTTPRIMSVLTPLYSRLRTRPRRGSKSFKCKQTKTSL